jgi:hypothetical protein
MDHDNTKTRMITIVAKANSVKVSDDHHLSLLLLLFLLFHYLHYFLLHYILLFLYLLLLFLLLLPFYFRCCPIVTATSWYSTIRCSSCSSMPPSA